MKKLFLLFAVFSLVFVGCSDDDDDDKGGSSEWTDIVAYMAEQGEIECLEYSDDMDEEYDALIKFTANNDLISVYADDSAPESSEREWMLLGSFDKKSVSGSIGNLSFESKIFINGRDEICKVTYKSNDNFNIRVTQYESDGSSYDAWVLYNKK